LTIFLWEVEDQLKVEKFRQSIYCDCKHNRVYHPDENSTRCVKCDCKEFHYNSKLKDKTLKKAPKTCVRCGNTFSESDKACWNCFGMRFTRGVESSKCKTCGTELYRWTERHDPKQSYQNTCALRSHFYCNEHDIYCNNNKSRQSPSFLVELF
jgi:hypothetical protein